MGDLEKSFHAWLKLHYPDVHSTSLTYHRLMHAFVGGFQDAMHTLELEDADADDGSTGD